MVLSECCNVRATKAQCATGWYIAGRKVTEWYECTNCKQPCDILDEEGEYYEQQQQGSCENTVEEREQRGTSGEREKLGHWLDP